MTAVGLGVFVTAMEAGVLVNVQRIEAPVLPVGFGNKRLKLVPVPLENGLEPLRQAQVVE